MAKKNQNVNLDAQDELYVHEEAPKVKATEKAANFFRSTKGKTTAIVAGSALAAAAVFGIGFSAGAVNHPFDGQRFGQGQQQGFGDHDGNRGDNGEHGKFGPMGQQGQPAPMPGQPGQPGQPGPTGQQQGPAAGFPDRDGDGPHSAPGQQVAPNGGTLPAPNSTSGTTTTP